MKFNIYNNLDEKVAVIDKLEDGYNLKFNNESKEGLPFLLREGREEDFLKSRVLPSGRYGISEKMERLGRKEYTWIDLIKLNSGRTLTDDFYVLVEENGLETEKVTDSGISLVELDEEGETES